MTQTTATYLTHHFLIAMPHMADPRFVHSLIYLCEHSEEGAMGIVINQLSGLNLSDIIEQAAPDVDVPPSVGLRPVYNGGPVQTERGFVLHSGHTRWEASLDLGALHLTTSRDILVDMAHGAGPDESLVALGYAGWEAGQLDQELGDNCWLSVPAEHHILFQVPSEQRLAAAAQSLGIDLNLLTSQAGHA
ncbi:YqgE/AlgH family protein [Halopseudomonas nanhaiensis]|uniref:YqgE/AlgH family protein n=1 Tax=Halopseudomonas nanhaiensis TaxID=2830842 RepID=UPI001CC04BB5|nr:YqgE/AlgH family protein [Halopseudomonas nanhaiensis]UAW98239.1 YqgE/AlgH family protein [Halopseudomonas nanhaiensis]